MEKTCIYLIFEVSFINKIMAKLQILFMIINLDTTSTKYKICKFHITNQFF